MAVALSSAPKMPFGGLHPELVLSSSLSGSMFPLQIVKTEFVSPS